MVGSLHPKANIVKKRRNVTRLLHAAIIRNFVCVNFHEDFSSGFENGV
jgi:hypothetical protein